MEPAYRPAGRIAAFATCVTPTVAAATPVKTVATRMDLLRLDLLLAAFISRFPIFAGLGDLTYQK
jgi:hypothetical protein